MTELTWAAVPGRGGRNGSDRVAAVLVPRLEGAGDRLADHGMDRWPELLQECSFQVVCDDGAGEVSVPASVAPAVTPEQLQRNWYEMFLRPRDPAGQGSFVELIPSPRPADPSRQRAGSVSIVPTGAEARALRKALVEAQTSGDWSASKAAVVVSDVLDGAGGNVRQQRIRQRGTRRSRQEPPPLDFHARVALLREHPLVLRHLGLIVDLEAKLPETASRIRLEVQIPSWPAGPTPRMVTPWTLCRRSDGVLLAREDDPDAEIARGMVRLRRADVAIEGDEDAAWVLSTIDVDAAMTGLASLRESEQGSGQCPAMRSAGLILIRNHRADALERRMTAKRSRLPSELSAEDLVLGYRLDLRRGEGDWIPLGRRRAEYEIAGSRCTPEGGAVEEAHIKPDTMTRPEPGSTDLEGDEQVARWDGWSLAVPRPVPTRRQTPRSTTALTWNYQVEPPAPRLRFGSYYALRARVVDIAGSGLQPEDLPADFDDRELLTESIQYLRVEPIPAPVLYATDPPESERWTLGRDLDRLVIRSPGAPGGAPTGDTDERVLAAPPISVDLAEQHGMFDAAYDAGADAWSLASQAVRDQSDPVPGQPVSWLPDPMATGWALRELEPPVPPGVEEDERWHGAWPNPHAVRLSLRTGNAREVESSDRHIEVRLPPATTIRLELASASNTTFVDDLALAHWAPAASADSIKRDVRNGSHPHLTPGRELTFVHAVQRPLLEPTVTGCTVDRPAGATDAKIRFADLTVDAASTSHIDVRAAWSDRTESGAVGHPERHTFPPIDIPLEGRAVSTLRQEFGDTRRRRVTYTLDAVSRFRDYFPDMDESGQFTVTGRSVEVDVPSTVRPPAPHLEHVSAAVRWTTPDLAPGWRETRRLRQGGYLRVDLGDTWYATGEGEALAVLVTAEEFPKPGMWEFLSEAARDPVRATPAPRRFFDLEAPEGSERLQSESPEIGRQVNFIVVHPWRDESAGTFYADIDLTSIADASYQPMVRLCLARWQENTRQAPGLSTPVHTELISLLPTRELMVRRHQGSIEFTLRGIGPNAGPRPTVYAWIEEWEGIPGAAPTAPTTDFVDDGGPDRPAWVQRTPWTNGHLGSPPTRISLPPDLSPQSRLVVCEFDELTPAPDEPLHVTGRRVTFIDTIPLR